MSDLIFNLRVLWWHVQLTRSWEVRVGSNDYWKPEHGKLKWYNLVWLYW